MLSGACAPNRLLRIVRCRNIFQAITKIPGLSKPVALGNRIFGHLHGEVIAIGPGLLIAARHRERMPLVRKHRVAGEWTQTVSVVSADSGLRRTIAAFSPGA
jgi:hypothetical protein